MIPEALHLRNFLSHQQTDLDLRGVHLASLVGDNGAGKSALLDGITWAIWGRSRAAYGHDEDLIYHGEDFMEVEFTFRMPYQSGAERSFRILRRREQRGRRSSTSILDFQTQGEAGWVSLNGDSIRETQARISEQLGLEYDTFINSAYLRQGRADEFTIQTASERKRVLSAILGLDRWEDYLEETKKRRAEVNGALQSLERRLEETQAELARRPEYEAALHEAEAEATAAEAQLHEIQQTVNALTRLQEQAAALERTLQGLDRQLAAAREQQTALTAEQESHRAQRDAYQTLLAEDEVIQARYAAYQEALQAERRWGEVLSQTARLQEQKAALEQEIAAARAQLEQQHSDLLGQRRLLEERLPTEATLAELEERSAQQAYFAQVAEELEQARHDLHTAEVTRSQLVERNRQLKTKMNETKAQLDTLAEAEAGCPLCRQPLTPEHHTRLLEQIQAEGQAMGDEYRDNQAQLQALQEETQALTQQLETHTQLLRDRAQVEQALTRLQQQVEQGEAAQERITQLQAEAAPLAARLAAEDYATEARATLAEALAQLATLGYDAAAHEEAKAQVTALSAAEGELRELEKARVGLTGAEAALKRVAAALAQQAQQLEVLAAERAAQETALAELQPRLATAPQLAQQLSEARRIEAEARQRVGAARQTLAALATLEKRLTEMQAEHGTLGCRLAILTELREAFGVNGIPAMIIEHTLPELEREANRILQRLTGGRMHIRFDTQRETKSGTTRETLDIIISDEKGTRPYENFSGGEQFRVNFAIRVALSRLLAQRAGVRLRSLFVDEGFGALDAEGRQRLVEAIKAVQSDFNLVLVITHVEELREAFPVRIQVIKTDAGSQVEII